VPEIDRAQFLRLGVAGVVGAVGAGLLAGPAAAALPTPAPQGDDVGFLSFGVVAEIASRAWYQQAQRAKGFSAGERRRLAQGHAAKADHIRRMNALLGGDAIHAGDFDTSFPDRSFATKARALALGERIESLLVGTYLNGAAFARDSATRLLLGRMLTFDAQQLAWMRGVGGGAAATGLPIPLSLEQAGTTLDRLVTTPNFPTS
jgi:ferritin-like protein